MDTSPPKPLELDPAFKNTLPPSVVDEPTENTIFDPGPEFEAPVEISKEPEDSPAPVES